MEPGGPWICRCDGRCDERNERARKLWDVAKDMTFEPQPRFVGLKASEIYELLLKEGNDEADR